MGRFCAPNPRRTQGPAGGPPQPNRETCQHGQLVGQCTECTKTTGR